MNNGGEIPEPNEVPGTPDEYPVNPEPTEPGYPATPEPEPKDTPEPDFSHSS